MMRKTLLLLAATVACAFSAQARKTYTLSSPEGRLQTTVAADDALTYAVTFDGPPRGGGPPGCGDGVENIRHASETTGVYGADGGAEQCGGGHHNIFTADYGCKFHDFAFLYRKVTGTVGRESCPMVLISAKAAPLSHIGLDVVDNREFSFVFALLRVVSGGVDDVVTPG